MNGVKGLSQPKRNSSYRVSIMHNEWKPKTTWYALAHWQVPPTSPRLLEFHCTVGGSKPPSTMARLPVGLICSSKWQSLLGRLPKMHCTSCQLWWFFFLAIWYNYEAVCNTSSTAYIEVSFAFKSHEKAFHWPWIVLLLLRFNAWSLLQYRSTGQSKGRLQQ